MSRDREKERLEAQEPQPGMSRFDQAWNAAHGVNSLGMRETEPDADDIAYRFAGELVRRHAAIHAGDRVTANMLLEAGTRISVLVKRCDELRARVTELERKVRDDR